MTTLGAVLAEGRAALRSAGLESPALDSRLLLADAARLDMAALIARTGEDAPPLAQARFQSYVKRRLAGEPVARILGQKEFWGLPFRLSASTLVPRPETETLVEIVLAEAQRHPVPQPTICDLGTGSGAILIALLAELPEARGLGTDISDEALMTAQLNAERCGVLDRASFSNSDFREGPEGPFNIVVSNPPYIRSSDIAGLAAEVRNHDPRPALDGGADGLEAYRQILSRAGSLVAEDGLIAFEVGHDASMEVAALCRSAGFTEVAVYPDLSEVNRVVVGRRPMSATSQN